MIIYMLLVAHLLADFTFQSTKMADNKEKGVKFVAVHSFVYAAVFLVPFLGFVKLENIIFPYIVIVGSHFLIDWLRQIIEDKFSGKGTAFIIFILDQVLHIAIIFAVFENFVLSGNAVLRYCQGLPHFDTLLVYTLIFVSIWDPAAVFIKKLFIYMSSNKGEQESSKEDEKGTKGRNLKEEDPKIGRTIGKLERLIIVVLVLYDQFGAIGFVLTAKSIARYEQLKEQEFAERYLVGTLASTAISLIVTIFLKSIYT